MLAALSKYAEISSLLCEPLALNYRTFRSQNLPQGMYEVISTMLMEIHVLYIRKATGSK